MNIKELNEIRDRLFEEYLSYHDSYHDGRSISLPTMINILDAILEKEEEEEEIKEKENE